MTTCGDSIHARLPLLLAESSQSALRDQHMHMQMFMNISCEHNSCDAGAGRQCTAYTMHLHPANTEQLNNSKDLPHRLNWWC